MKNTKALCLIILGSFLSTAAPAFAGSMNQLQDGNLFSDGRSASATPTLGMQKGTGVPTLTVAAPPPAPAKPTMMESIKGFIGDNARNMLLGGVGAYIGFVLLGPIGLLIGGLLFLAAGTL
ncbi:MAG: hypothetical protein PHV36_13680 [Elusimicrobiales bacterium]|nr:hypothetical protein [Elusimicrobiales bacterium]